MAQKLEYQLRFKDGDGYQTKLIIAKNLREAKLLLQQTNPGCYNVHENIWARRSITAAEEGRMAGEAIGEQQNSIERPEDALLKMILADLDQIC